MPKLHTWHSSKEGWSRGKGAKSRTWGMQVEYHTVTRFFRDGGQVTCSCSLGTWWKCACCGLLVICYSLDTSIMLVQMNLEFWMVNSALSRCSSANPVGYQGQSTEKASKLHTNLRSHLWSYLNVFQNLNRGMSSAPFSLLYSTWQPKTAPHHKFRCARCRWSWSIWQRGRKYS